MIKEQKIDKTTMHEMKYGLILVTCNDKGKMLEKSVAVSRAQKIIDDKCILFDINKLKRETTIFH